MGISLNNTRIRIDCSYLGNIVIRMRILDANVNLAFYGTGYGSRIELYAASARNSVLSRVYSSSLNTYLGT